jgi:phage terminase Nu1 subunit (DNA packaging protein)
MGTMRNSLPSDWVTVADAAQEVQRSRRTLERWIRTGLPIQRVRGVRYIKTYDLYARLRLILTTEPEVKTRRELKSDVTPS